MQPPQSLTAPQAPLSWGSPAPTSRHCRGKAYFPHFSFLSGTQSRKMPQWWPHQSLLVPPASRDSTGLPPSCSGHREPICVLAFPGPFPRLLFSWSPSPSLYLWGQSWSGQSRVPHTAFRDTPSSSPTCSTSLPSKELRALSTYSRPVTDALAPHALPRTCGPRPRGWGGVSAHPCTSHRCGWALSLVLRVAPVVVGSAGGLTIPGTSPPPVTEEAGGGRTEPCV